MVKYMVAIDGSNHGERAFQWVLNTMNKDEDTLFVLGVAERIFYGVFAPNVSYNHILSAQHEVQKETRRLVSAYAKRARSAGVSVWPLLSTASSIGEAVCSAAKVKQVDTLVLGSRGHGSVASFFLGSTSKYCVNHAECNVVVVKADAKEEEHTDVKDIIAKEEEERARRMADLKDDEKDEKKLAEARRKLAAAEEEAERWRRIHENDELSAKAKKAREEAAHKIEEALRTKKDDEKLPHPVDDTHSHTLYELVQFE